MENLDRKERNRTNKEGRKTRKTEYFSKNINKIRGKRMKRRFFLLLRGILREKINCQTMRYKKNRKERKMRGHLYRRENNGKKVQKRDGNAMLREEKENNVRKRRRVKRES